MPDASTHIQFATMRGTLNVAGMPGGLLWALRKYDDMRAAGSYERADAKSRRPAAEIGEHLARLQRGMGRLTYRSVLAVARRHSGVCPVYVRQHHSTLSSLMGLFYWNDGTGETRRRLLLLAWRKGAKQ